MKALPFNVDLPAIVQALRSGRGFAHKRDIHRVMSLLDRHGATASMAQTVDVGDDCAVLPNPAGTGHLLLAIEGLVADFVAAQPWFAGYSAVMVNCADVYAMGGRPLAVVDALWSAPDAQDATHAAEMLRGMADAAARYGVPLVGGHSNLHAREPQLAVAILGHATRLITSFAARPGDVLLMAVDLRGRFQDPYPFWNASTEAPAERLRGDFTLLPQIAEAGLCDAGKDISMAGALGTALMLLECSGCGARIDLAALPRPALVQDAATLLRWLSAFPSFGFMLAVRPERVAAVQARFTERSLACAAIGMVTRGTQVHLGLGSETALLWDFDDMPFITAGREAAHA